MRVVSLLPAGTEIVAALGGGGQLVGVSHECDHPPDVVAGLPRVSTATIDPTLPGGAIDAAVRARLAEGRPLLSVDEEAIRALEPDAVIIQDVCEVCAVGAGAVRPLAASLALRVVTLSARDLSGVFRDIRLVAELLDLAPEAEELVAGLESRLRRLAAGRPAEPPRVACLEWLEPPYLAGHWVPEQVQAAGGRDVGGAPGEPSRRVAWEDVAALRADLAVVALCGLGIDRARHELAALTSRPAVEFFERVPTWLVDGNAFTSRAGPRVVDGARCIQDALRGRAGPDVVRWRPGARSSSTAGG